MTRIAALALLIALGATYRSGIVADTPACVPQACAIPLP
ncbi:hypothetical protein SAMN05444002_2894 [Vannielia litorea]|uniref:Uncharacterized protein n=1 Tax=Vannielia litorea TaxID=1217970 RepID=A0A1N6GY89_9RHOB|nr:hypothetical protein SAMN05444002_2894 [Vannielia litorea]